MKINKKIIGIAKNKFVLATLLFAVYLTFFDSNSLIYQYRLKSSLNKLQYEKAFYQSEIEKDRKVTEMLTHDTAALEKFAREKYLMKRDNEDIFLIIDEDSDKK